MTREGYPCVVPPHWHFLFGDDHAPADLFDGWKSGAGGKLPVDVWHVAPPPMPSIRRGRRVTRSCRIVRCCRDCPRWTRRHPTRRSGSAGCFTTPPATCSTDGPRRDGDTPSAWNSERFALLGFTPRPVPANTDVEADLYFAAAYLAGGKRDSQRVALTFNGQNLGTWRIDAHTPSPLKMLIPATVWNSQPTAAFRLEFPDAISPMEIGESMDARTLAVAGEKLVFHLVPAPAN